MAEIHVEGFIGCSWITKVGRKFGKGWTANWLDTDMVKNKMGYRETLSLIP